MKIGIVLAVMLHGGFILFGGLLFNSDKENKATLQQVNLLDDSAAQKEEKKEKPKEQKTERDEVAQEDKPKDVDQVIQELDRSPANLAPRLDALSLGAMEDLLSGKSSGGADFGGESMSFASGGGIGGTGKPGALAEKFAETFSLAEIDQKPRVVNEPPPAYPAEMRGKSIEGVVTVVFVVDEAGKVGNQRAEKSSHEAFERPALDAVKQWKFEPAIRAGKRVACKMRVTIRFQRS